MRLVLVVIALLLAACSGNDILEPCETGGDCQSGLCLEARPRTGADVDHFCSQPCDSTCPDDAVCAATHSNVSHCVVPCTEDVYAVLVCDDGVPVYCDQGGSQLDCAVCGCNTFDRPLCDPDTRQCGAARPVGEPCASPLECGSGNCGELPGSEQPTCFDRAGESCTDATCGACDPVDGALTCAQACSSHGECGDDRARCYRQGDEDQAYCRQDCEFVACPGGFTCQVVQDPGLVVARPFCFPS